MEGLRKNEKCEQDIERMLSAHHADIFLGKNREYFLKGKAQYG
jgi:hypothetical protein